MWEVVDCRQATLMAGVEVSSRQRLTGTRETVNEVRRPCAVMHHFENGRYALPTSVVISSKSCAACDCAFELPPALAAFAKLKAIFAFRYSGPSSCEGVGGSVGCSTSNERRPSGAACVMLMLRGTRGSLSGLARKRSRNFCLEMVLSVG